ncbi:TetR/AcrR family transcriptional regulator [Gordonia sp. ABSL1-1]|uniref:TetR/AcrR family transcriptional regulator n=1 Tax=Gordonia sp. ABSL1-1 TaxID=3053923 RepID=UPI002572F2DA|nr:TetR/AcrR family transcriptional regulator [Gordonia sp. ABSL1-1]MDL9937058.1 TetR/AcrR family transcriptional regulator [Gordonia sp. ABSL1-1]
MSPEARRDQLLTLGMEMIAQRPLEQVSIEAIAEAAGVSRALLFHYFESKQHFHIAIAQKQADDMLVCTAPDESLQDPLEILRSSLANFVDYISENSVAYQVFVRGAASADPAMREIFDRTRQVMASRVLDHGPAFGITVTPIVEVAVHGWMSFVEEVAIGWLTDPVMSRDELLGMITAALPAIIAASGAPVTT